MDYLLMSGLNAVVGIADKPPPPRKKNQSLLTCVDSANYLVHQHMLALPTTCLLFSDLHRRPSRNCPDLPSDLLGVQVRLTPSLIDAAACRGAERSHARIESTRTSHILTQPFVCFPRDVQPTGHDCCWVGKQDSACIYRLLLLFCYWESISITVRILS